MFGNSNVNLKNICEICFMESNENNLDINKLNCCYLHKICKDCIIEYLKEEIKNARVLKIKCPKGKCTEIFTLENIKELVDNEVFYKYKKFLRSEKIKNDKSLIVCTFVNCEGFANKDGSQEEKLGIKIGENNPNLINNTNVLLEINNQ